MVLKDGSLQILTINGQKWNIGFLHIKFLSGETLWWTIIIDSNESSQRILVFEKSENMKYQDCEKN